MANMLLDFLAGGKDPSHVTGLQSEFAARLARFMSAAPGAITLNSGYRSEERQAQLWEEALAKYGSPEAARKWVAPPGASQHNHGAAADLGYADDATKAWAHENAAQYGLNFRMAHEPWHVEMIDGQPTAVADATGEPLPTPPGGLAGLLGAGFAPGGGSAPPAPMAAPQPLPAGTGNVQGTDPRSMAALLQELQAASQAPLTKRLG